jgi:ferredoxin
MTEPPPTAEKPRAQGGRCAGLSNRQHPPERPKGRIGRKGDDSIFTEAGRLICWATGDGRTAIELWTSGRSFTSRADNTIEQTPRCAGGHEVQRGVAACPVAALTVDRMF